MTATVTAIKTARKPAKAPVIAERKLARIKIKRQLQTAAFCGAVQAVILAVSLSHQAAGVEMIAVGIMPAAAWAMAVAIDVGFQALELATIFASTEHLRRELERFTKPATILTLTMSAGMNSLGFTAHASAWWQWAGGIGLGCFIPYMLWTLTRVATKSYMHAVR